MSRSHPEAPVDSSAIRIAPEVPTDVANGPLAAPQLRSERLDAGTKFAFSAQGFFGAAMGLLVAVYMGKFYVDVVLLPAGMYAIAIAAGGVVNAIGDPIMGYVSDHTDSRWGRRHPWIVLGILGNAVIFYLMLTPSRELSTEGVMLWFLVMYVSHFLFVTMSNVPRQALGAELTLDASERVSLFGWVATFTALGLLAGVLVPVFLQRGASDLDARARMTLQAGLYLAGYLALNAWFVIRLRERVEFQGRGHAPFIPGVRRALRNRPFVIMFASHVLTAVPLAMPASLMPFFVQYVLKVPDSAREGWTGALILTYIVSGFLALPVWIALARRFGKLRVWLINGFIGVTGGALMFFAGEGDQWYVLAIEVYVGLQSQVWLMLGGAMHADVIDYDELHTGKRREAQFSSLWSIIPKFAMIPGAAIPLAVLGGVGYVPNLLHQAPEVVFTLSVLFALVPAAFNALGMGLMWWYPLSEAKHAEIRQAVARHAAGEAAEDPITGRLLPAPTQHPESNQLGWFLDYFSARELRAYADRGGSPLPSALFWTALCAACACAAAVYAYSHVHGFERDPGPSPSLAIVAAGAAFTGALFHALRIRPALKLKAEPVRVELVREHLAQIQ